MTGGAPPAILELGEAAERPKVRVKGREFELVSVDDLSFSDAAAVEKRAKQFLTLSVSFSKNDGEITAQKETQYVTACDTLLRKILIDHTMLEHISNMQRIEVATFFCGLLLNRQKGITERIQSAIGDKAETGNAPAPPVETGGTPTNHESGQTASPDSSDSTEALQTGGSPKRPPS